MEGGRCQCRYPEETVSWGVARARGWGPGCSLGPGWDVDRPTVCHRDASSPGGLVILPQSGAGKAESVEGVELDPSLRRPGPGGLLTQPRSAPPPPSRASRPGHFRARLPGLLVLL